MTDEASVFSRAWGDVRGTASHLWFQVPAALFTVGIAAVSALLPSDASTGARLGAAIAGSLGGAFIIGLPAFAYFVVRAPIQQRDEAREELRRHSDSSSSDPRGLITAFSTWLRAKRAALPEWPNVGFVFATNAEVREKQDADRNAAMLRYEETANEVLRQTRIEYHERFREAVLAVLGASSIEEADDPRRIHDFVAVERLLEYQVNGTSAPTPEAVADLRKNLDEALGLDPSPSPDRASKSPARGADKLCDWALKTWELLRREFVQYSAEFYGDYRPVGREAFKVAFNEQTLATGRDAYLADRVRLLEQVLSEHDADSAIPA